MSTRGLRCTVQSPSRPSIGPKLSYKRDLLQSKSIQERKPIRNQSKAADHEQHSERDQQAAAGNFESVHVGAEATVELEETLHQKRRHQKRYSQAKRIDREQ